eukprot:7388298-Prymnesium_polylepis.1
MLAGWEIASLVQRTTLTGWLLLIDIDLQFIRLIAALCISVAFLVGLLACQPYKRKADYAIASGCQVLNPTSNFDSAPARACLQAHTPSMAYCPPRSPTPDTQVLFVCTFIGGLVVRLYEDIAHDSVGSPELAYRFLGLRS